MKMIADKFKFSLPLAPCIKEADTRILLNEREQMLLPSEMEWPGFEGVEPLPGVRRVFDPDVVRPYDPNRFNPISGTCNPVSPPLRMWYVGEDEPDGPDGRRSEGRVTFGLAHQGPPGHAHGGAVAGVYDDFLGRSQHQAGFTGKVTVTFRKPTPLDRELELRAWVSKVDGRKRWVTGTCRAISLGRTLATHEIVVTDEDGRRLSTVRITNFLKPREPV